MGGPQAPQRVIASWAFWSAGFALPIVLALMPLLIQGMAAQGIRGAKSEGATLRGTVHDRSGSWWAMRMWSFWEGLRKPQGKLPPTPQAALHFLA